MLVTSTVSKNRPHALRRARGFTLVELAVVVTIVGVLSVLAVVGYRRYILNSKVTEAQSLISAIKIAEEDVKSEKGTYVDIGHTNFCPSAAGVSNLKVAWDSTCNGGTTTWDQLPVHVDGPVQFSYAVTAGAGGSGAWPPSFTGVSTAYVNFGTQPTTPWYVVAAKCDLDPGGAVTTIVGTSMDNRLFTANQGQ